MRTSSISMGHLYHSYVSHNHRVPLTIQRSELEKHPISEGKTIKKMYLEPGNFPWLKNQRARSFYPLVMTNKAIEHGR